MTEIEDIHVPFLAWLNELEVPYVYHRPDRKSGIQRGWPDFTVAWMGRVVFIEAKTPEGRLSTVQENVHKFIRASGNRVEICRSVEECKEAVNDILCLKVPETNEPKWNDRNFYIGNWKGKSYVFAPDRGGSFQMIREASVIDRLYLPSLP